ncbi:hypothetical protein BRC79_02230 [Halobacteriales archaeon QH_8_67_27]|nr:MAG: hypothetical protein BRC79_02230 [Halobacteriales archaeon QH_8_67_27]
MGSLGFGDVTVSRVFIVECATPPAVTPLILLIEFGDSTEVGGVTVSEFASTVVMATMLVSIPALTLLLALLRSETV